MNDFATFIAAYWLYGEEEGHTVHWSEAKSAYRHRNENEENEFLKPYYERVQKMAEKLSQAKI